MKGTSIQSNLLPSVPPKIDNRVGRLPFFEKLAYGFGGGAENLMSNVIFVLAMPIYHVALGVDVRLVGIAISIPRLWDAFTDPLMGHLSDNTRLKWGRRRPYIFSGAIITGLMCMILWWPPIHLGQGYMFAYLLVISILFFTSYTVFDVPFNALGYELTDDYDERTHLMGFKFFTVSLVAVMFMPWAYKACFWFGDNEVKGVRVVGLIFGLAMMFFGIVPALFCKERARYQNQEKISLLMSLRFVARNKPFLIICGVILFVIMGIFMAIPLQLFMNLAYVLPADRSTSATFVSYTMLTYGVMGFLTVPLINMLSARYGKKTTLLFGLFYVMGGCLLSWFYYTPTNPYLQILFGVFVSPGMSCIWMLTPSCVADICDIDELATGMRREGIYGAVYTWLMKTGVAGVLFISGFIISWSGFDRELIHQSSTTILRLRLTFAISPVLLLIVAVVLMSFYPITRQKVMETQLQLLEKKEPV